MEKGKTESFQRENLATMGVKATMPYQTYSTYLPKYRQPSSSSIKKFELEYEGRYPKE